MGTRRIGREFAVQALYLADISKRTPEESLVSLVRGENLDKKTMEFSVRLVDGTRRAKEELDKIIMEFSENWEMKRMSAIDRNVLRLGAYELVYELDTPISVIIDEAVDIAKKFSTRDSGKFVNGILDKVKTKRNGKSEISQS